MKKNRTEFQSRFGKDNQKPCGLQQMETYFLLNNLTASKDLLNNIMHYAVDRSSRIKEEPSVIFHFHQAIRSFIRAAYLLALEKKKWTANTQLEEVSPLAFGLLSEKEYKNPLLVFKKAFQEYSVREFDYFISGMVYLSLGMYDHLPERNMISPYIHLIKMLDAGYLIMERNGKEY